MKFIKYFSLLGLLVILSACSEDIMDDINKNRNDASILDAKNLLPDAIVKTAAETTSSDMAWYATVYIEHNAGTWGQSYEADRRSGQDVSSVMNNSWNSVYDVMNILDKMIRQTDSTDGTEPDNFWVRGVAQILMAYNLAVTTDMWGDVPYTEAFKGLDNLKPKYDKQSEIYVAINGLLNDAIVNIGKSTRYYADKDMIYGHLGLANNKAAWIRAANSLKARYAMRLSQRNPSASADALKAIAGGFANASQQMLFDKYVDDLPNANPWWEFWYVRDHLSISQTFYNILIARNDPRIPYFIFKVGGVYKPAPSGEAIQTQGGYSQSALSTSFNIAWNPPTPLMSFHELKFIETEAKFRTNDATWRESLQEAIAAVFEYHGVEESAEDYFTDNVEPLLTPGNELKEIMMQKYIAMFEFEAMEAYNDYRRTGIPTMRNPQNAVVGFVNRFPYALSETSSNSANVPQINIYKDKVWWAGGN